jgi:hypothetical protein
MSPIISTSSVKHEGLGLDGKNGKVHAHEDHFYEG